MLEGEFLIRISEYSAARDASTEITYVISNEQIQINGEEVNEDLANKIDSVKSVINSRENEIEEISNSKQSNYKGGLQKVLSIIANNQRYRVVGNTSNEEAAKLYKELKEEIEKIIK